MNYVSIKYFVGELDLLNCEAQGWMPRLQGNSFRRPWTRKMPCYVLRKLPPSEEAYRIFTSHKDVGHPQSSQFNLRKADMNVKTSDTDKTYDNVV